MKKRFHVLLVSTLVLLSLIIPIDIVHAYTFTPASGSYTAGTSIQIQLFAAPPAANDVAVNISLAASNMTITNYVPNTAAFPLTVNCGGAGSSFTATTICISESKSGGGTIANGDLLGTITANLNADPATLTKQSDNAYSDGTTQTPDTTGSASFTVTGSSGSSSSTSSLPNTAVGEDSRDVKFIILVAFIGFLITAFIINKLYQLSRNIQQTEE